MEKNDPKIIARSSEIVSAFVSNNSVRVSDLGALIESVHASLMQISGATPAEAAPAPAEPAVSIRKSVSNDFIYCLEDGKKFKSIRRHLMTAHGMTPEQYREKWSLPPQYPMVAPAYASARSDLAKNSGLGRMNGQKASPEDAPSEEAETEAPATAEASPAPSDAPVKKTRGRPRSKPVE